MVVHFALTDASSLRMGWVEEQKVKNPKILPNKFLKGEKH